MKTPLLINKNEDNDSILVDSISLKHDYIYILGRKLENGNYIKKLFSLETINEIFPFTLKEINIIDKEDKNSRFIPIKILIGKIRTFCLCINENELIEEIIKNNKENSGINNKVKILINESNHSYKEEQIMKNMDKIYNSNDLNRFLEIFNSLSDKNIKDLIKSLEGIRTKDIRTKDIYYNEFISYLENKTELNDLLSFFIKNEKNEGKILFSYLKTRIDLIEKNIMNYIYINNSLNSEIFIKKIIEQNILYSNDDFRVQYFYSILLNIIDYNNQNNNRRKLITIDRFKGMNFKEKFNENNIPDNLLTETIFGQLFHSLGNLNGKEFLREKGDRLFIVNLKGERAQDVSGPYNEILSETFNDLQSDYIELFIKTPNNINNLGELRDR